MWSQPFLIYSQNSMAVKLLHFKLVQASFLLFKINGSSSGQIAKIISNTDFLPKENIIDDLINSVEHLSPKYLHYLFSFTKFDSSLQHFAHIFGKQMYKCLHDIFCKCKSILGLQYCWYCDNYTLKLLNNIYIQYLLSFSFDQNPSFLLPNRPYISCWNG